MKVQTGNWDWSLGDDHPDDYWCEACECIHRESEAGRVDHGDTRWAPHTCEAQAEEYAARVEESREYVLQVRSDWMSGKRLPS